MERAEELISIATEHGFSFWASSGTLQRGWALANEGRQEGIAEICRAISELGPTAAINLMYAALAESYGKQGRAEEGLAAVGGALEEAQRSGEKLVEAELYGIKGRLLLMGDQPDETQAEHCFRIAIDISRQRKARFLELRTTTSLAHLLKRQAKPDEARAMLTDIYNWFTEGFEFADLKDAKALLDELGE